MPYAIAAVKWEEDVCCKEVEGERKERGKEESLFVAASAKMLLIPTNRSSKPGGTEIEQGRVSPAEKLQ